jgi:hypothetical protein
VTGNISTVNAATIIPARGVVEFSVARDADFEVIGHIDGPEGWSRPVVGLIHDPEIRDADPRSLPYAPVVAAEWGLLYTASDYVAMVGYNLFDCAAVYRPEIDGPVDDAPRRAIPATVAEA